MVVAQKINKANGKVTELPVQKSIEQQVYDWMSELTVGGHDSGEAADVVVERVIEAGLSASAWRRFGREAVMYFWRREHHVEREAVFGRMHPSRIPERRVDIERLKEHASIMESLYKVGKGWVRLGDMAADDCKILARYYRQVERSSSTKAAAFERIHKVLDDKGGLVEKHFTEEQLKALFAPEQEHAA